LEQILEDEAVKVKDSYTIEEVIDEPEPTIIKGGYTIAESYCGTVDQTWKIKYRNYVNGYHINGYIIIETISISYGRSINRVDNYYLLSDVTPNDYIEGMHTERNNLADTRYRKYDYEDTEQSLKVVSLANSNFFDLFRTAEDVIRASLMTGNDIVTWDEVLKAAERQKYRIKGVPAQ
jgi:hypothetical protein